MSSLTDITGLFSRYFVVGFLAPAFFTLLAARQILSGEFVPRDLARYPVATELLILGGTTAAVALLLNGMGRPIMRLYEGYPLRVRPLLERVLGDERGGRLAVRVELLTRWQRRRRAGCYSRWRAIKDLADAPQAELDRLQAAGASPEQLRVAELALKAAQSAIGARVRAIDRHFPPTPLVLPTAFGNIVRAAEHYGTSRWQIDSVLAWPRLWPLCTDAEREAFAETESSVYFFLNASLGAGLLGVLYVIDGGLHDPALAASEWALRIAPFALAAVFYRMAVSAAWEWGDTIRAVVDLHLLELFAKLGLAVPPTAAQRRELASAVQRLFDFGTALPDDALAAPANGAADPRQPGLLGALRQLIGGGGDATAAEERSER